MAFMNLIPVSVIIPTANRTVVLRKTLESISNQDLQPSEIIIVDASDIENLNNVSFKISGLRSEILHYQAEEKGAAIQRCQGIRNASKPYIMFMDDDIILEYECLNKLWLGINSDDSVGGISAMITNQRYHKPGKISKVIYRIMNGRKLESYAGKCIGPAMNLMPEDSPELPEYVEVDWINTTCSIYRKKSLPEPIFDNHFQGYSMMEDLTLSLRVGKNWKLINARTARIFHDSQNGDHKSNLKEMAKMEMVNRHYIMRKVLNKKGVGIFFKFLLLEFFFIVSSDKRFSFKLWLGKAAALKDIIINKD